MSFKSAIESDDHAFLDQLAFDVPNFDAYEAIALKHCWKTQPEIRLSATHNFRLLRVDSTGGIRLRCSLWECPESALRSNPISYSALSYCWGDAQPYHEILINGVPVQITPGLVSALKAADAYFYSPNLQAQLLRSTYTRLLWVDALCIHQADPVEKTQQVRRMDKIYSNANNVLVWLDDDYKDSALCMKVFHWLEMNFLIRDMLESAEKGALALLLRNLRQYTRSIYRDHDVAKSDLVALLELTSSMNTGHWYDLPVPEETRLASLESSHISQGAFGPNKPWWTSFLSLMQRSWFERIWTLQEIVLARTASVLCGTNSVDWNMYRLIRHTYLGQRWHNILYNDRNLKDSGCTPRGIPEDPRYELYNSPFQGMARLDFLLSNRGHRLARDPRDYVFGMLGLLDSDLRSKLEFTYDSPTSTVYIGLFQIICEESPDSKLLCELLEQYMHRPRNPALQLPTWCPDLSGKPLHGFLPLDGWETVSDAVVDGCLLATKPIVVLEAGELHWSALKLDEVSLSAKIAPPMTIWENFALQQRPLFRVGECRAWFHRVLNIVTICHQSRTMPEYHPPLYTLFNDAYEVSDEHLLQMLEEASNGSAPTSLHMSLTRLSFPCVGKYFFLTKANRLGYSATPVNPGD